MDLTERNIERLQNNLQAIRKLAGLTTAELGHLIGVTKQTISNIENRKTKMTKTQYLALCTVLNTLIMRSDNQKLEQIIKVLLTPDADEKEEINRLVNNPMLTPRDVSSPNTEKNTLVDCSPTIESYTKKTRTTTGAASSLLALGLGPVGIASTIGMLAVASIISSLDAMKKDKN